MATIWFFIIFLILVIGYGVMSFRMSDLNDKYNSLELDWKLIPEDRLSDCLRKQYSSTIVCECGCINENIYGFPYAFDEENKDVIYAYKCQECGKILYVRD